MKHVLLVVFALLSSASAHAQVRTDVRAAIAKDGTAVRVVTLWGKKSTARLEIGDAKPIVLSDGLAAGAVTTGHGVTVVALAVDSVNDPFELRVLDGKQPSKPTKLARPNDRYDMPFAVALAVTPDGFAAFFQEVQTDDPSAAHTYLELLDDKGAAIGTPKEIAVPWSLGDAAWNGTGFHLALYYSDGRGVRLSMVTATKDGAPQGHPDWASRSGAVSEVHLVASNGKVRAFYRGGGGDHLYEADVTNIGSWGSEPPAPKDRGALGWSQTIAITAKGEPSKVKGAAR